MNNKKLRVAFIGMAHVHVMTLGRDFRRYPEQLDIVGIADYPPYTDEEYELRKKLNVSEDLQFKFWDDYKELLSQNIDIAVVTTDIKDHARATEEILALGINVVVEKPMALDMDDARRMYPCCAQKHRRAYHKLAYRLVSCISQGERACRQRCRRRYTQSSIQKSVNPWTV